MTEDTKVSMSKEVMDEFTAILDRLPADPSADEEMRSFFRRHRTLNENEENLLRYSLTRHYDEIENAANQVRFFAFPLIAIGITLIMAAVVPALLYAEGKFYTPSMTVLSLTGIVILIGGVALMRASYRRQQRSALIADKCTDALRISSEVKAE